MPALVRVRLGGWAGAPGGGRTEGSGGVRRRARATRDPQKVGGASLRCFLQAEHDAHQQTSR